MRLFLCIAFVFVFKTSYSQPDCSRIKTAYDEMKGQTGYAIKSGLKMPPFSITKTEYGDKKEFTIDFLIKTAFCNDDMIGVFIKLDNGEILRYPDTKLKCQYLPYDAGWYFLQGSITINDELHEKLKNSKIIQYSLGGLNVPIKYKKDDDFYNLIECAFK